MNTVITVVFIVAHNGYQAIEYGVAKKLLEQAGIRVITASNGPSPATAHDGTQCSVDLLIEDIDLATIDGIFIVGGPGALDALNTPSVHTLIQQAANEHKKIGAICISSRILAQAGVLENKQATGWNGDNELADIFKRYNVHYKPVDVVRDGDILTATGPEATREYGEQIISMLS